MKNWRSISLLSTDLKIFPKSLAANLKSALLPLVDLQQTAYGHNRYIGERGRLIFDILDISDKLNIDNYLVTANIEKSFDPEFTDFC